jgi:hypothetical protein
MAYHPVPAAPARSGRATQGNNTQQLARTVYEVGYLTKIDGLYSDTSRVARRLGGTGSASV